MPASIKVRADSSRPTATMNALTARNFFMSRLLRERDPVPQAPAEASCSELAAPASSSAPVTPGSATTGLRDDGDADPSTSRPGYLPGSRAVTTR